MVWIPASLCCFTQRGQHVSCMLLETLASPPSVMSLSLPNETGRFRRREDQEALLHADGRRHGPIICLQHRPNGRMLRRSFASSQYFDAQYWVFLRSRRQIATIRYQCVFMEASLSLCATTPSLPPYFSPPSRSTQTEPVRWNLGARS